MTDGRRFDVCDGGVVIAGSVPLVEAFAAKARRVRERPWSDPRVVELTTREGGGVMADGARVCGWRVGPIPKLGGKVVICVLPDGHEPPHEDERGDWFQGCGRASGTPHPVELVTREGQR